MGADGTTGDTPAVAPDESLPPPAGERVIWEGVPRDYRTPTFAKLCAVVFATAAAVCIAFAAVQAWALAQLPTALIQLAVWCGIQGPHWWMSRVRYMITDRSVITQRGRLRRTIERKAISFARIYWDPRNLERGDLELVRSVPTGALRRRLTITLHAVHAPDRVWAIVRGVEDRVPVGLGGRPLTQRLDEGERVLWAARPRHTWRVWLPRGPREWLLMGTASLLASAVSVMGTDGVGALRELLAAGLPAGSPAFAALVAGMSATAVLLTAGVAFFVRESVVKRARLGTDTHYLLTDSRVLIQRGLEELLLDRRRVIEVIDTVAPGGGRNLYFVLDGPQARAFAASGAFGESEVGPQLKPVFECVEDAEGALRSLREAAGPARGGVLSVS
jgi:hypothetical protein